MAMFLRKGLVVAGPLLLCLLTSQLFRWLDGVFPDGSFLLYAVKGIALGLCVGLLLPAGGLSVKSVGLAGFFYVAAGLLLLALVYQYLETVGVLCWPWLRAILSLNGQVVLIESTAMGFLTLTAALNTRRRK
ncbi:MAG: hypothetical protein GX418_11440 [Clostridiales bacterium]|nr:hypothetical protein [Clostridiales bacterium]